MAFLIVASQTIPVTMEAFDGEDVPIGETGRAFDGSARSSVRGWKSQWEVTTAWMAQSDAETLITALKGAPPLAASGDLTGSLNVVISAIRRVGHKKLATGEGYQVAFTMMEA